MTILAKLSLPKVLAIILVILGLSICLINYPFRSISSTPLQLNTPSGYLVGRIYYPLETKKPFPVVILGHGVSSSKEMLIPLALELARNKIASISFDFGGFGESYSVPTSQHSIASLNKTTLQDARNILHYIRDHHQQFDQEKIAMVGHSLGGITAINLGKQEKSLKATVSLGIGGEADLNSPSNLLFAMGVYDQLNPPQNLRPLLVSATENKQNCDDGQVCGDFSDGKARKLVFSPTADHVTAIYDSILIQETINWLQQSWQLKATTLPPVMPQYIIGLLVLTIGLIIALTEFLLSYPILIRRRLLPITMIIIIIFSSLTQLWLPIMSNLIIIGLIITFTANYASKYPSQWFSRYQIPSYLFLLLLTSLWIPSVCQNLGELINDPAYISYLPLFTLKWLFFGLYNSFVTFKTIIFPQYTFQLKINILVMLILLIETIQLGIIVTTIEKGGLLILRRLNQPFKWGIKNISRQELVILGFLTIILCLVIWQRFHDGLLKESIEYGWEALRLFVLFIVIPVLVMVLGVRALKLK